MQIYERMLIFLSTTLIKNPRIVDGTGSPWFNGYVVIQGSKITDMGTGKEPRTPHVIDAEGHVLSPGFIDIHTHSDTSLLLDPRSRIKMVQGVTTEVIGQCGNSAAPLTDKGREMVKEDLERQGITPDWSSMAEYLERLSARGTGVNVVPVVGHGTVRKQVMGYDDREPDAGELVQMKELIREAMEDGAFGVSTGLIYPPGSYAQTDELIQVAREAAGYGGLYMTHMRNESDRLLESLEEALEIGRSAGLPVHISHHKAVGRLNWGKVKETLKRTEEARMEGIDATFDQYPYTAASTGLASLLPHWVQEGGKEKCLARLKDPDTRERIKKSVEKKVTERQTWADILVSAVITEGNKKYEGKSIEEIARARNQSPPEAVVSLVEQERLGCKMVSFGMDEDDVKTVMRHPLVMIGSDGRGYHPGGKPHPRSFGTFPRVLGKYSREEKIIALEEAVRKMTGLPAWRMGLYRRGLIRPGFYADLVIFSPEKIRDTATFQNPHQDPGGIEMVMVNGEKMLFRGEESEALPGKVLNRNKPA